MSDSIRLEVNGQRIEKFISYSIEADLYVADHAFSLEVKNGIDVRKGQPCKLYVNDQLELTGVIEHLNQRTDKQGSRLQIEGRDLMGLLVDSFCEQFVTVEGKSLSGLAEMLLKDVPFINRKQIVYQKDLVGKLKSRRSGRGGAVSLVQMMTSAGGGAERIAQIHPGMTKFQVLSMYALSRGQMFFSLPDGTFVFGRPMAGGAPDYSIVVNPEGKGHDWLSAEVDENISKAFSKVTVVGQQQGQVSDGLDMHKINVGGASATVTDASFPFYKPFVQLSGNDSQTPKDHARLLLEKMRHDATKLVYEMPRHSQGGKNFTVNRIARVDDTVHRIDGKPISGVWLVSGRGFKMDKGGGPRTTLKLTPPGLVADGSLKGKSR